MAEESGLAIAGYLLAYTLIRKLETKDVLTRHEAEELIEGAIRQLKAAAGPRDAALAEAEAVLKETLSLVHEEDEPASS